MQKFYKPLKVKKTCIDLRSIGAQEQHEEGIARMRATEYATRLQDERGDLCELIGVPTPPPPPIPSYNTPRTTWRQGMRIITSALNPMKYRP